MAKCRHTIPVTGVFGRPRVGRRMDRASPIDRAARCGWLGAAG
ncbi:hypothetical protein SF06_17270 [Pseudomonas flexibilis]|nr:hypothetical protein SF06_17270 [Pseudomonas flexibilis]